MRSPIVLLACLAWLASPADASVDVQLVVNVPNLIDIQHAGDGSGRLFLVEQSGQIVIYNGSHLLPTPFLDISGLVTFGGEQGLLGLAFHPQYASNGFFYVHYSDKPAGNTVIARYHVSASDPDVADPSSATAVLSQQQPFANHNGGQIRFGPDGFLYIALGDGGAGGDPFDFGQHLDTLLGKLLRIDVDSASPYAVPESNPFKHTPGALGEIWAYGLRNPWRFAFDRLTGDVIIGDVGQNAWEEADFQAAGVGGLNYGWRLMEGLHCYEPSTGCNTAGLTMPIVEYAHALGCAVMGGFRYRGAALPGYAGTYFFADECSGRIWGAAQGAGGNWTATELRDTSMIVTTFGEDPAGELYLSHYSSDPAVGGLYRLVTAAALPKLTVSVIGDGRITTSPADLDCGMVCSADLAAGSVRTLVPTASPGWTFAGWSGDADCADGVVTLAADRTCVAKFGNAFTDDAIVVGSTPIRAVHVTELRSRIDALRASVGLPAFQWTDTVLEAGSGALLAVHVREMRTALDAVYGSAGKAAPNFTNPGLAAGDAVLAAYITELRNAVLALE